VASSSVRAPFTIRLPFNASSVSVARQRLKTFMSDAGGSRESVEDARMVVSELVANAVRHARPLADGGLLLTCTLEGDHEVQLSVTDGGSGTRPRHVQAPTSALAGRGMAIVDLLARDWWTERDDSRSTVHAVLDV
jgi:serine/threonine-protein kinase RsbW